MTTTAQLSLTIERDTEFITASSTALYEYIEPEMLKRATKSKNLLKEWDEKSYAHSSTKKATKYSNEIEVIRDYRKLQNKQTGLVKVNYYKSKCGYGRAFVAKCLGLTNMRRVLRNALIRTHYVDIDLENAQIRIACELCEIGGYKNIENLKKYVDERDVVLAEVMKRYECSRKDAKNLMIMLSFGGTFEQWVYKTKVKNRDVWEYLRLFEKEMVGISNFFKEANPILWESCRQKKEAKNPNKEERDKEIRRSFIATYLQHWECKIISTCMKYLYNETDCLDHCGVKVGTYEYDGFKMLRKGFERFNGDMLRTLEQIVKEKIGLSVVFAIKEMDEFLEIEELPLGEEAVLPEDLTPITEVGDMIRKLASDTEYALYINKHYPKQFIWCEDKKEWVCWNEVKWDKSAICLYRHISYHIPNALEEKFKPYEEVYDKIVKQKMKMAKEDDDEAELSIDECAYILTKEFLYGGERKKSFREVVGENYKIKAVAECCKTWLRNEGIVFDAKDYLTGFNNGVYDLFTNTFRPYRYDDFVSMTTGFDFSPINRMLVGSYDAEGNYTEEWNCSEGAPHFNEAEEKAFDNLLGSKGELIKIFPDPEIRAFVLTILSKIFYGKPLEYCAVFNGSGGNGKGVLDEFIQYIFGDYCSVADYGLITQDKSKAEGANEAVVSLHRKRLVFMSEPEKSSKINNGAFKAFTGGTPISARGLFEKQSKVILSHILVLECNERLKFKDIPKVKGAEHRRLMDILFPSRFTIEEEDWDEAKHIYPASPELKTDEWRNAHRNVMYNILIKYALDLRDAQFVFTIPNPVKDRVEEYLSSCNDIHSIFDEIYEKVNMKGEDGKDIPLTQDNIISIPDVAKRIKNHTMFRDLPKDIRTEFSKSSYLKEFFMTDSKYKMKYSNQVLRIDAIDNEGKKSKLKFSEYLIGYKLRSEDEVESESEEQ